MPYSRMQVLYHWLTFAIVLVLAASGMAYAWELGDKGVLTLHQVAGQLLIVVLAVRIATRIATPKGPTVVDHPVWERRLAGATHVALYIVLIAYVATGYVSASALSNSALLAPINLGFARSDTGELLLEIHYALKLVLLLLVGLHIAGALKHALWDRDATLSHISLRSTKG